MVMLRAGLYERVSTEEQARTGASIAAQIAALEEYCEKNNIKIVDHYTDEGVSGGKPAFKRPQMARLLEDVEAGKIDVILFTKIDRWFRNVAEYHKVQEVLDRNRVHWQCIHEAYETLTADGRLKVNIMLSVAQQERERDGERVAAVFEHKRKNKEATFGWNSMPFGYTKEKDENGIFRLVKNPELQDALQEFWDLAVRWENVSKAAKFVNNKYGLTRSKKLWFGVVHNEIYTGTYKGIEDFGPAYVSREEWEALQNRGTIRQAQKNRIYLFAGLIKCPTCGKTMSSTHCRQTRKNGDVVDYLSYRCRHKELKLCPNNKSVSQNRTEQWLLANLEDLIRLEIKKVETEKSKPKKKPKTNIATLKENLRRLEVVYRAGNKSDDEYIAEAKEIKALIAKAENEKAEDPAERDLTALQKIIETDFSTAYAAMDAEHKRLFWRNLIKEIHVEGNDVTSVDFIF